MAACSDLALHLWLPSADRRVRRASERIVADEEIFAAWAMAKTRAYTVAVYPESKDSCVVAPTKNPCPPSL